MTNMKWRTDDWPGEMTGIDIVYWRNIVRIHDSYETILFAWVIINEEKRRKWRHYSVLVGIQLLIPYSDMMTLFCVCDDLPLLLFVVFSVLILLMKVCWRLLLDDILCNCEERKYEQWRWRYWLLCIDYRGREAIIDTVIPAILFGNEENEHCAMRNIIMTKLPIILKTRKWEQWRY